MSRFSGAAGPPHSLSSARGIKRKRQLSHLPGDSINPLSHPPAVLKQFHVAGFPNSEPPPSDSIIDFPHRPWKDAGPATLTSDVKCDSTTGSTGTFSPSEAASIKNGGSGREKFLSSLRECVQVCLGRGDVHRAKKAMAGLSYAANNPPRGHSDTCPWSLQAEFIMADGEHMSEPTGQSEDDDQKTQPRCRDSDKTMSKLREYLSSLIAEQSKGVSNPISGPLLNLWWALLSAELYGASEKYPAARHTQLKDGKTKEDESDSSFLGATEAAGSSTPHLEPQPMSESRPGNVNVEKCKEGKGRDVALATAETTVRHLGRLMHSKPYKMDQNMLHLYAAALLFLADLKIPCRHDLRVKYPEAHLERDVLRNQAKGILDDIVCLGGHIDHRLQRILDVPISG